MKSRHPNHRAQAVSKAISSSRQNVTKAASSQCEDLVGMVLRRYLADRQAGRTKL